MKLIKSISIFALLSINSAWGIVSAYDISGVLNEVTFAANIPYNNAPISGTATLDLDSVASGFNSAEAIFDFVEWDFTVDGAGGNDIQFSNSGDTFDSATFHVDHVDNTFNLVFIEDINGEPERTFLRIEYDAGYDVLSLPGGTPLSTFLSPTASFATPDHFQAPRFFPVLNASVLMTLEESSFSPVPEPSIYALVLGIAAFVFIFWRHRINA